MTQQWQAARTNRYAGECRNCGQHVPAGAGELTWVGDPQSDTGRRGGWAVIHVQDGTCERNQARRVAGVASRKSAAADLECEREAFVAATEAATGLKKAVRDGHNQKYAGSILRKGNRIIESPHFLALEWWDGTGAEEKLVGFVLGENVPDPFKSNPYR